MANQLVAQYLLGIGSIREPLGSHDDLLNLTLVGKNDLILVGGIHDHNLIPVGNQFLDGVVDFLKRNLMVKFAGVVQLIFHRHQRFTAQEVAHA